MKLEQKEAFTRTSEIYNGDDSDKCASGLYNTGNRD